MASLQNTVRKYLFTIMSLLIIGGFAMLLAELLLTDHTGGIQNVAVIASGLGLAFAAIGLFVRGGVRIALAILLLLLSLSGLIGAFEHFEEGGQERETRQSQTPVSLGSLNGTVVDIANRVNSVLQQEEDEEDDREGRAEADGESAPPPLAPLSLTGLAIMGSVMLLAKPD